MRLFRSFSMIGASAIKCCYAVFEWLVSAGLPVSANAINKDVGVHMKVSLNVTHRVVSSARIAE